MKWEDTVLLIPFTNDLRYVICDHCAYRQAQAEYSFKAGVKEVVDWLNQDSNTLEIEVGGGIARVIDRYAWQAQLKEWGITP